VNIISLDLVFAVKIAEGEQPRPLYDFLGAGGSLHHFSFSSLLYLWFRLSVDVQQYTNISVCVLAKLPGNDGVTGGTHISL
jgi:hypothetical protein